MPSTLPYNGYIIVDPYAETEWFKQWPRGADMKLYLMVLCNEGQVVYFPEGHDLQTPLDRHSGHPMVQYSPIFDSIEDAKRDIDAWKKTHG